MSDHISLKSTSDIQIITPTNKIESGLYTVLFGDTGKVLIWNLKQLKDFLPSMMLMKEMTTKTIIKPDSSKSKSVVEKIELCKQLTEAPLIFDKIFFGLSCHIYLIFLNVYHLHIHMFD